MLSTIFDWSSEPSVTKVSTGNYSPAIAPNRFIHAELPAEYSRAGVARPFSRLLY
jgi:hypothetical protein